MSDMHDAKSIFLAATEKSSTAERGDFLEKACGEDAQLRDRVEALLAAYDRHDSFLEKPAVQPAASEASPTVDMPSTSESVGTVIDSYKLLQQIGEGGFGVVYMAEQLEPVRRRVALKIIKPGMDSQQVIARFEAERQALAMMDHQNIARVLDAGTTEGGRPYFVMELVKGMPITAYCDQNKLTPRERLELFIPACQAIQHAHQKGIIHRDIKPSNVLICLYDGKPVPKVIDFGVAKAIEQRLTEKTMFTEHGQIVGTLEYMSPEQAELNQLDIDTRSDIYSLGVLLYELLTGSTPIPQEQLRDAGFVEMLRLIREVEPEKPSTRLSQSGDALAAISAQRKSEPTKLPLLLRGELDWIVMKALEKDRTRRYDTANALAQDVDRYLKDEAVEACPPSTWYRVGKFARRHRAWLTTAAVFVLLLVTGTVVSAWQAVLATRARALALESRLQAEAAYLEAEAERQRAQAAEGDAKESAEDATAAAERAQDALARSLFEQARAVRLAAEPNRRYQALELLKRAEQLRGRARLAPSAAGQVTMQLPPREQLRSEAVASLLLNDGRVAKSWDGLVHSVSPEGRFVSSVWLDATMNEGGLRVVNVQTGDSLLNVSGERAEKIAGTMLATAPRARRMATVSMNFRSIQLIDVASGEVQRTLEVPSGDTPSAANLLRGLSFSPDGRWLVASKGRAADVELFLWDLHDESQSDGRLVASVPRQPLYQPTFSPDSRLLAWKSADDEVTLWNLPAGSEERTIKLPLLIDTPIDFDAGGTIIAVHAHYGGDEEGGLAKRPGAIVLWDLATDDEVSRLSTGTGFLATTIALSDAGERVVVGQHGGRMRVFDVRDGDVFDLDHGAMLQAVKWAPGGEQLISAGLGHCRLWELTMETPEEVRQLAASRAASTVSRFSVSPDGEMVAAEFDAAQKLALFDRSTGKLLRELDIEDRPFPAGWLTFTPDSEKLLRFGFDAVLIWDVGGGDVGGDSQPRRIPSDVFRGRAVTSAGFRNDGTILLGGMDALRPWVKDATSGEVVWSSDVKTPGSLVRLSRDGELVISHSGSGESRSITVRQLPSARIVHELPSMAKGWTFQTQLEISPDKRWVLELDSNSPLMMFPAPSKPGASGFGTSMMGGNERPWRATLWNLQSGERHLEFAGDANPLEVAFSPDGRYLAVFQRDGRTLLLNLDTKQQLFHWRVGLTTPDLNVASRGLEFSSDSRSLVVADPSLPRLRFLKLDELDSQLQELGLGW